MIADTDLTGGQICAPQRDAIRFRHSIGLSFVTYWITAIFKLMAIALLSGLLTITSLHAAPSCGLEKWLTSLNTTANAYVRAIGTQNELAAARSFYIQMERYSRAQLIEQINESGLRDNKEALEAFITARRYLYDLSKDNWGQMATRFGEDVRFEQQSQSMITFLQKTECDPFAEDFLNDTNRKKSMLQRITTAASSLTRSDAPLADGSPASDLTFDPNNFDDFRASRYTPKTPTIVIPLSPSQNAPVFLGLFTFIVSASIWVWMRIGIAQRRAMRYPCSLPIVIFDGSVPIIGELTDLSQLGAKLETGLKVGVKSKLLITMNTTRRKAWVAWTNTHFIGIKFEKALTETEMTGLLEGFADQVVAAKETHGGFETLIDDVYGTAVLPLDDDLATSRVEPDQEDASTLEEDPVSTDDLYFTSANPEIEHDTASNDAPFDTSIDTDDTDVSSREPFEEPARPTAPQVTDEADVAA